jgi:predicted 3-demethylubiquinone-9 3-methyltransferase (glyoxalase superfamily)
MAKKITTHLWFDKEAKEAAEFYTSLLPDSKVTKTMTLHNTPSGDCDVVSFELAGQPFMAISAGPYFKFNPSISFHIKCKTKEEVDAVWAKLSPGGKVLMELGPYPFSERYGWTEDKYGLSWQVIYVGDADMKQRITPVLMYVGSVAGKTEEAINFYASVFPNSKADVLSRYNKGEEPEKEGSVRYASFTLNGQEFGAMDSARQHDFKFNEAISFLVSCEDQKEIDYYWEKLSAVPESEQCGWLKDRFGVSWQVSPTALDDIMNSNDQEKIDRVTQVFLKMKKFNLAELEKAAKGE